MSPGRRLVVVALLAIWVVGVLAMSVAAASLQRQTETQCETVAHSGNGLTVCLGGN